MSHGEYEVIGKREYRGHAPGVIFEVRLDHRRNALARAVQRGDVRFIREIEAALQPGTYRFPDGWLAAGTDPTTEAPKGASLIGKG